MSCGIRNGVFSQTGGVVFFHDRATSIVGGAHVHGRSARDMRRARREAYEDCRRKIVQERYNAQLRAWSVCPKPAPSVEPVWLPRAA